MARALLSISLVLSLFMVVATFFTHLLAFVNYVFMGACLSLILFSVFSAYHVIQTLRLAVGNAVSMKLEAGHENDNRLLTMAYRATLVQISSMIFVCVLFIVGGIMVSAEVSPMTVYTGATLVHAGEMMVFFLLVFVVFPPPPPVKKQRGSKGTLRKGNTISKMSISKQPTIKTPLTPHGTLPRSSFANNKVSASTEDGAGAGGKASPMIDIRIVPAVSVRDSLRSSVQRGSVDAVSLRGSVVPALNASAVFDLGDAAGHYTKLRTPSVTPEPIHRQVGE